MALNLLNFQNHCFSSVLTPNSLLQAFMSFKMSLGGKCLPETPRGSFLKYNCCLVTLLYRILWVSGCFCCYCRITKYPKLVAQAAIILLCSGIHMDPRLQKGCSRDAVCLHSIWTLSWENPTIEDDNTWGTEIIWKLIYSQFCRLCLMFSPLDFSFPFSNMGVLLVFNS